MQTQPESSTPQLPPVAEPLGLSAKQVAARLGISESLLYSMKKTGRFGPQVKRLCGAIRYDRVEIDDWFRAGCPSRDRWNMRWNGEAR
jgi:predicted DNA-binding transcriptional regulator AlpA